jgi:hypothetical protein
MYDSTPVPVQTIYAEEYSVPPYDIIIHVAHYSSSFYAYGVQVQVPGNAR